MANTTLMSLVTAGIMIVVLGFVLSIGQSIAVQNAATVCDTVGGTWVTNLWNTTNASNHMAANPATSSYTGCCSTLNRSGTYGYPEGVENGGHCDNWTTASYAVNSSYYSMTANNTLAYWIPIIALAIAAGFVISILIVYLLGSVTGRQEASV